jgi:hypothetical protein
VSTSSSAAVHRERLSVACHHLALAAVGGASDELALTLAPAFRLHLRDLVTDRWGYLALLEAEHALSPVAAIPLDVISGTVSGDCVTLGLQPRCLAHFRVIDGVITELWLTADWDVWSRWLGDHDLA